MKNIVALVFILAVGLFGCNKSEEQGCAIGAFLSDHPSGQAIEAFATDYGKKPFFVLIFLDWGKYPDPQMVREVYETGSVLMVTWEPWKAIPKTGIDYDAILSGKEDPYIREFARQLKAVHKPVFLRFAHEMNGDWYPWAGQKIGGEKYQKLFKYLRKIFNEEQAVNVQWVFSINAENIPAGNRYEACYPGDDYVDYIGLDGYNWGTTQSWSKWRTFQDIFSGIYKDIQQRYPKPILISEFGTTSKGGDKARWIEEALAFIKKMPAIKGAVVFNVDKETDWRFEPGTPSGKKFKEGLAAPYFKGASEK